MSGRMGSSILKITKWLTVNPRYVKVLQYLAKSDTRWVLVRDLKKKHGIDTSTCGEDYSSWMQFASRMKVCGYVETKKDEKTHLSSIRVLPNQHQYIVKILEVAGNGS